MSLLRLIERYKNVDYTGLIPVVVPHDAKQTVIGWTKDDVAQKLSRLGDTWIYDANCLTLNPIYADYQSRTDAVDVNMLEASEQGVLPEKPDYSAIGGDDWYIVGAHRFHPLFEMRRFYSIFLGVRRYASRINAYHGDQMWISTRGTGVHEYAGALDNLVTAGQVAGRTIYEHALVEAHEEAGLSEQDCAAMRSTGMIHIARHTSAGFVFDENIYVYDLDTQGSITPSIVNEWETAKIELWSFDKILETVKTTDQFRPEASLCLIDFFIRHGVITPDNDPDYDALCFGLRSAVNYSATRLIQQKV
jgi:hypothetical protein